MFGADEEEELPTLPADQQLRLEDLDDDDEDSDTETDILDLEGPDAELKEVTATE